MIVCSSIHLPILFYCLWSILLTMEKVISESSGFFNHRAKFTTSHLIIPQVTWKPIRKQAVTGILRSK